MTSLLTVLMPVYNGEKYLAEAIDSILCQTFTDFEFLIINDGSIDGTSDILKKYQQKDKRIRVISHKKNHGLVASLNEGLKAAKGEYIARMDADDISLPSRLENQLNYLKSHPEIGVLGTSYQCITSQGILGKVVHPYTDPAVNSFFGLLFNPVAHPTACFQKKTVQSEGYRESMLYAEDFNLWSAIRSQTQFSNLSEILLYYRVKSQSISCNYKNVQNKHANEIAARNVRNYIHCSLRDAEILRTSFQLSYSNCLTSFWQTWLLTKLFLVFCHKENISFSSRVKILWSLRLFNPIYQLFTYLIKH